MKVTNRVGLFLLSTSALLNFCLKPTHLHLYTELYIEKILIGKVFFFIKLYKILDIYSSKNTCLFLYIRSHFSPYTSKHHPNSVIANVIIITISIKKYICTLTLFYSTKIENVMANIPKNLQC